MDRFTTPIMGFAVVIALFAPVFFIVAVISAITLSRSFRFWWRAFVFDVFAVIVCVVIASCAGEPIEERADSLVEAVNVSNGIQLVDGELGEYGKEVTIPSKIYGEYTYTWYMVPPGQYEVFSESSNATLYVVSDSSSDNVLIDFSAKNKGDSRQITIPKGTHVEITMGATFSLVPLAESSKKVDLTTPYEQIYKEFSKDFAAAKALYCGNCYRIKAKMEVLPAEGYGTVTFAQWIGGTEKIILTAEFGEVWAGELKSIAPGSVVTFTGICTGQTSFEDCELVAG